MQITAALLIPALLIYLGIPTALFGILEYFLSRTESPWPGRVLPILSALCSVGGGLLLLFNLASQNLPAAFLSLAGSANPHFEHPNPGLSADATAPPGNGLLKKRTWTR